MAEGVFKAPQLPPGLEVSSEDALDPSAPSTSEGAEKAESKEMFKLEKPMSISAPPLEYTPPVWGSEPEKDVEYKFEIIRNGAIVDYFDLSKRRNGSFVVIGRLPTCDIVLEHPSISRYHCILQ